MALRRLEPPIERTSADESAAELRTDGPTSPCRCDL
eukprot:CAMPEP_0183443158 /NCGR_PEP_ID=MMETSP0370-20130417/90815_1 /TAXON_ID=268820 /ORGANISM="Peridinium aciculiferum, Strain PAER-2" /LENGTH=35 /DNA_ID= /DNA_START= /DNA_END= /DNA_ORIENTATION=